MSEPKTTCDECNRPILQRTADRKGGLCAICHGAAARIPPDDFVLPAFLRKRILSLGKSTERYREMAWREGNDYVHEFLDRQDKADALYAEWLPKLRKFAKECRRDRAYDPSRRLRISDLAKQRIYRTKFEKENWIPRAGPVPIFTLPLIAISVAEQVWPVGNLGSDHWWTIDDAPDSEPDNMSVGDWHNIDIPKGSVPWVVSVGSMYGPLAGGGHSEVWSWDGREASFVQECVQWIG
jgi:hypothetical protein